MEIFFEPLAMEDLAYWKTSGNQKILKKIRQLLESIEQSPFTGIGKPEALKYNLSGKWSRRLSGEHRIVYKVENDRITVYQLRFHYCCFCLNPEKCCSRSGFLAFGQGIFNNNTAILPPPGCLSFALFCILLHPQIS